jgi:hypothetical protein
VSVCSNGIVFAGSPLGTPARVLAQAGCKRVHVRTEKLCTPPTLAQDAFLLLHISTTWLVGGCWAVQ